MTKAQIHFSNHLEELINVLKDNLFSRGSGPFEKRLIAVPHLGLKSYLMQALAKDPDLQVAAGMQIVNLSEAFAKITKNIFPSVLELSLFLQHALLPLIDENSQLAHYFGTAAREKRIGPFCDTLSRHFLRYAIFGKGKLPPWQEQLWKKLPWRFPTSKNFPRFKGQVHLFGFTFLPQTFFSFFQELGAHMYLFSPCSIFWGDFYGERERSFLAREVPDSQLDFFEASFEGQNPLLASWGQVGRKMLIMVEESEIPTQEHYVEKEGKNCLRNLQNDFLAGAFTKPKADASVSFVSATTRMREVEILRNQLVVLFNEEEIAPSDVQVFAPDITLYAPYIHAVFGDIAYSISGLEMREVDPIAKAFGKMIALPKVRFALDEVIQVLMDLKKFDFDIGHVKKWCGLAHIRWGFSKQQRRVLYLQDIEESELAANPEEGTWEYGLRRLLLGLAQLEGEETPLPAIAATEMEEFDQLYRLLYSLADDLAPFYDGTKWTIPTWLRYFATLLECYFTIDPSYELYKQLHQLASASDRLDQREIPFVGVERALLQLLGQKNKTHQPPHLQAIQFGSLAEGCALPGKVIALLGMQEETFPRREEKDSLAREERDYRPTKMQRDRYLFLQIVASAREFLQVSYMRSEGAISTVVQELISHIEGAEIIKHQAQPYFVPKDKEHLPLLIGFNESITLQPPEEKPIEIDVQKLFKFARHPLRYFFHEVLGIYPDFGRKDEGEYFLDLLTKYQLVREALTKPLEEVLQEAKKRGELPVHLLEPLAKGQIKREVNQWREALEEFGIAPEELQTEKINLQVGKFQLKGKLELSTSKGLLVSGKESLEDQIRFWPHALLMKKLGRPVLLAKEKTPLFIEGSLEHYLEYFVLASKYPSPLLPAFGKALLEGTPADLKKELKKVDDEIWAFLFFRDPMPSAEMIHANWSEYLRILFGRVDAAV